MEEQSRVSESINSGSGRYVQHNAAAKGFGLIVEPEDSTKSCYGDSIQNVYSRLLITGGFIRCMTEHNRYEFGLANRWN